MDHDTRVLRARAKAKNLKVRAYEVQTGLWRVKCGGSCSTHKATKAGTFSWHFVRLKFQAFFCDCDGAAWGVPCVHVGAVERRLIRASYRSMTPAEREQWRELTGMKARAA